MSRAGDPCPPSAVSGAVGIAGLAGLAAWIAVARLFGMDGPYSALVALLCCGAPMVVWSLAVDKVHRRASTGIAWDAPPRPWREAIDISLVKLAGLWATWGGIAVVYMVARWYWDGNYAFAMRVLGAAVPFLVLFSVPYLLWLDRRLVEPRDGTYAFGAWLIGAGRDGPAIRAHLRQWAVKGFFLAFMLSIVPGGFGEVVRTPWRDAFADPVALARYLITAMFVIDVQVATVGYVLTLRPLDAHIRSAEPTMAGWVAALICYPPFVLMANGGPLDYHSGTGDWADWLAGHPLPAAVLGAVLVLLTAVYAWATVAFGLRFSNLTHRGILTHGPYRWSRHPAYLSKNLFWWLSTLPFLATTGSLVDAARNTALLAVVAGVYWWRARTEEAHLGADPAYRAYSAWMERNAPVPRLIRWIGGRPGGERVGADSA
ncbi:methyltransferase family protein [Sphingomonas flavalba]|uniref:methyltransferase family protein n=1 Tax=Sphingomonas flavalba TaxID=2559804 RepID=UPI00109E2026|nr:DUF1295 domain-containing protein [Sphingomonas flavalba]